jgi:hypothetical protein
VFVYKHRFPTFQDTLAFDMVYISDPHTHALFLRRRYLRYLLSDEDVTDPNLDQVLPLVVQQIHHWSKTKIRHALGAAE